MFNIYDYFKSEELVKDLKKLNWQFSELEKIKLIYDSKKPIDFKIKGLKYIASNTVNEAVSDLADKIIYMYNDMFEIMEETNDNTYYRVYASIVGLDYNPTYRTLKEAISFIKEFSPNVLYEKDTFSITRYEYDEENKEIIDLRFIYDKNGEVIDITYQNENYFDYDLVELNDIYINLPVVLEDHELEMVAVYNPDPEFTEDYYLLSNNQKGKKVELECLFSKNNYIDKHRFSGPVFTDANVNVDGNIALCNGCINEFVNMYFICEEFKHRLNSLAPLYMVRKMIQDENK